MSANTANANPKVNSVVGLSKLVRPKFAPGMLLQHDDLEQLTSYTRELSRLLFRSFFGCGVVCGLCVKREENCGRIEIAVDPGLALDCSGDPIYVPKRTRVVIDETCTETVTGPLWVLLCATKKCCSPRTSGCGCDDDDDASPVCTRERDAFEIRVVGGQQAPKCACACPERPKQKKEMAGMEQTQQQQVAEAAHGTGSPAVEKPDCQCADPGDRCYERHYRGECGCTGDEQSEGCCCSCVLLAKIEQRQEVWTENHTVRRFIRPVLMRDRGCEAIVTAATEVTSGDTAGWSVTQNPAQSAQSAQSAKPLKASKTKKS